MWPSNPNRRRGRDCKSGHPEDLRTGEFEEHKKNYRRCTCPIFGAGTIGAKRQRKSTGQWEWEAAKAVIAAWEGFPATSQVPVTSKVCKTRTTIQEAVDAFTARARNKGIVEPTLRNYKTFIKQLTAYCEGRGYVYMDQLTIDVMDRFYSGLADGAISKGKKLGMLRSLVEFPLKGKWLTEDISEDLEAPKGSTTSANKRRSQTTR